ncbi:unnamed protein product, partial [Didymodactylos carnosus]
VTARHVFATVHVVCYENVSLSVCTENIGRRIQKIFGSHYIRHFTLQFEYVSNKSDINECVYGVRGRKTGHESSTNSAIKERKDTVLPKFLVETL